MSGPSGSQSSPAKGTASTFGQVMCRTCCMCGDEVSAAVTTAYGKNSWIEKICKNNYNRQMEKSRANPRLRMWWKQLSDDERKQWYIRNKAAYVPCVTSRFDNAGFMEEEWADEVGDEEAALVNWLPLDDYFIRENQLGNLGDGTTAQRKERAKDKFLAHIMDKSKPSKKIGGVWCAGIFGGGQDKAFKMHKHKSSMKRKKTIGDVSDLNAAKELVTSAKGEMDRVHATLLESMAAGSSTDNGNAASEIDPSFLEEATVQRPDMGMGMDADMRRAVLVEQQRSSKLMMTE